MKKILLTFAFVGAVLLGKSQIVVLNEIYTDPGSGNSEFFELYNSSGGSINTDCYTILTYYTESGGKTGWYVMDLPAGTVLPTQFYVGAAANPFNVQQTSGVTANFSWNSMPASGSLTKWERNGTGYVPVAITFPLEDFFQKQTGNGASYSVLVYANGVLVNALFGGVSSNVIPAEIRNMPNLPVDMIGCTDFTAKFSVADLPNIKAEFVNAVPGNDNGYIRKKDGQCGQWDKGAPGPSHTPGRSNGAADANGSLQVSAVLSCPLIQTNAITLNYSVSGGGPADAYPVTIIIYEDRGRLDPGTPNVNENELPNGIFDAMDTIVHTDPNISSAGSGTLSFNVDPKVSPTAYTFPFPNNQRESRAFIVVFQTPQGCYDQVKFTTQCAVLPIKLTAFTAKRQNTNVVLNWETAFENDNYGFEIQRKIGGGEFETIGFVVSQAANGTSYSDLDYSFTDINNTNKGVSQYRLKQIDLNAKTSLSDIRAVRGQGMAGKTIVFPNPTSNGKVSVVFEDAEGTRDVSVIDMAGRTIKQMKGVVTNNIQIENLTPGMYTLRVVVRETGEQVVEKIVVNKR